MADWGVVSELRNVALGLPYLTAAVERGALGTVSMLANVCYADVVDCCRHARTGRSRESARGCPLPGRRPTMPRGGGRTGQ